MNTETFAPEKFVFELPALIVYDSPTAGKHAKELCDRLEQRFDGEGRLSLNVWNIAEINDAVLARILIAQASVAALLIIAVNGDTELTLPARNCLECCVRRLQGGALVVQLHGILKMEEEVISTYCFLKQYADDAGVKFYSQVIPSPDEELEPSLKSIHQRAELPSPMKDLVLELH